MVAAVFSAAIVLAEATISPLIPNLSVFSRALHRAAGNELETEMLAFIFLVCFFFSMCKLTPIITICSEILAYISCISVHAVGAMVHHHLSIGVRMQAYPCLCAYYGIYKLGRFSFYLLVPRHTSAYSLLANAMLMCRFAPPLAFNFMAGIALPPSKSYSPGRDVTETVCTAVALFVALDPYNQVRQVVLPLPSDVFGLHLKVYLPALCCCVHAG